MPLISIHDKATIKAFTDRNPKLHLFERGSLDDFFWPYTTWYGLEEGGAVRQLALLFHADTVLTLMAVPEPPIEEMHDLLEGICRLLPRRFYAHLHPQLADTLAEHYVIEPRGMVLRMGLAHPDRHSAYLSPLAQPLDESCLSELQAFYREVYPESWFTPRMLATRRYYGIWLDGKIASVAGVRVCSPEYDAAVLGNVATHPRMRGHGFARLVCARLCHELLQDGIHNIGLVVHAHNTSALAVYQALGFEPVAEIGTYMLTAN